MINTCTSIKNIELPKDDARCASILRTVIRNLKAQDKGMDSRAASIISAGGETETNQVYALRQKMFGSYLPNTRAGNQSRAASIVGEVERTEPISSRNKIFELRKVLFGRYS